MEKRKFNGTGLANMFAGRRKFFRGPHVRHLWRRYIVACQSINYRLTIRLTTAQVSLLLGQKEKSGIAHVESLMQVRAHCMQGCFYRVVRYVR